RLHPQDWALLQLSACAQASRIRSIKALPRSGFSTIGTLAPAARRASSAVGWLVIRIAGAETECSRNLQIRSKPAIPGILWSTTRQLQLGISWSPNSSEPLA